MSEILHLGRMRVRYRVDRDDPALRRRLNAVLDRVLGESLEPALARNGVPHGEEICLRSLRVPVRVRLDAGEAAAAAAWSAALADAIAATLASGPRPDVVRFRSRRAALTDLALGVAGRRLERIWAWRQLGLWQAGSAPTEREAAAELVTALAGEPESIVPVLAEVARAGSLPRLAERIEPSSWAELAQRALAAAGAPAAVRAGLAAEPAPEPKRAAAADRSPRPATAAAPHAERILRASAIARAASEFLRGAAAPRAPELARALAALSWLEAEPQAVGSPVTSSEVVAALADALATRTGPSPGPALDDDPAPAEASRASEAPASEAAPVDGDVAEAHRWTTAHGGLLFLLGVLDELGVPDAVTREGPLASRPLRWTLHRLAMTLVPVAAHDPAALAFAGLPPGAEPPSDDGEPWGEAELDALAAIGEQIEAHLRERLERPDAEAGELLDLVCRRPGEIVFDPGWIELRLPLDAVSSELRRAGLDLDPGWIPWLGVVVRFVYG